MTDHLYVRMESFGLTLYDPQDLSYRFLDHEQALAFLHTSGGMLLHEQGVSSNGLVSASFENAFLDGRKLVLRAAPGPLPVDTLAAPVRVYFEVTTRCNAHCRYCLNNSGAGREGELDTDEALQAIENLARDGVFEVRLTGGEPTERPDFFVLAKAVQSAGLSLTINSNLLVSRRILQNLELLQPRLLITSLDADEQAHNAYRPGYRRVVENIIRLRQAGVPVRINCALNRSTLPSLGQFIDQFALLGCAFTFILLRPVGRALNCFQPPALKDLIAAVQIIEERRKSWPGLYFSTSFHVVMEKEQVIGGINLTGCNAIQKSFNLNSDGTVLPCAFLFELAPAAFSLGNIRDTSYSVLPIWRDSALLREMRRGSAQCNARCIHCPHFKQDCLGSCYMMSVYEQITGQPDPYCRVNSLECLPGGDGVTEFER